MAKYTVQVVLRNDVEHLGRSGDIVRVKPGHARNYLVPRGLAALATRGNVAQVEHEKKAALVRGEKLRQEATQAAAKLNEVSVEVSAPAGGNGKLFGSVGTKDVAAALAALGHEVDRRKIVIPTPIKELGEHEVSIKLGHEIAATVKVSVVAAA